MSNLRETLLSDVSTSKDRLFALPWQSTVRHAVDWMNRENVLSVGVYSEPGDAFAGVVNIIDIMTYFTAFALNFSELNSDQWFTEVLFKLDVPLGSMLGCSPESKSGLWEYNTDDKLKDVYHTLILGVHRVLVQGPERPITRLLSQTDVIRFLCHKLNRIPCVDETIEQLKLIKKQPVFVAHAREIALEGYKRMAVEKISALPIVDEDGKLIETLSPSDLRGLAPKDFYSLNLPVKEFVSERRKANGSQYKRIIRCHAQDTLRRILVMLEHCHIHRVWVVDESEVPIGVISMTDAIRVALDPERY